MGEKKMCPSLVIEVLIPYSDEGAELGEELKEFLEARGLRVGNDEEDKQQPGWRVLTFGGMFESRKARKEREKKGEALDLDFLED